MAKVKKVTDETVVDTTAQDIEDSIVSEVLDIPATEPDGTVVTVTEYTDENGKQRATRVRTLNGEEIERTDYGL